MFALVYADIFQYPYTVDEIITWIPHNTWSKQDIIKHIHILSKNKILTYKKPFYVLHGHDAHIEIRKKRECIAQKKWEKAVFAASILRFIPTIMYIGVTGGLSMQNADKNDDIDFYVCTQKGAIWITRCIAAVFMEVIGRRRRPESKDVRDTICLNMFVAEDALGVLKNERDIYVAHEVLQMVTLWEKEGMYKKFLLNNTWVSDIFPNKWKEVVKKKNKYDIHYHGHMGMSFIVWICRKLEKPVRTIQLWYMKKRRTSEVVTESIIRFHPKDARVWIKSCLKKRLRIYQLPLDKKFFRL